MENNKINNLKPFFPTLPAKIILIYVLMVLMINVVGIPVLVFVIVYLYLIPLKFSHQFINNIYYENHLKIFYFMLITYFSITIGYLVIIFILTSASETTFSILSLLFLGLQMPTGFFTLYFGYIYKPFFKDKTSFLFINSRNFLELAKLNSNPISKFKNCIKGLQLYHNYLKNELKIKINLMVLIFRQILTH